MGLILGCLTANGLLNELLVCIVPAGCYFFFVEDSELNRYSRLSVVAAPLSYPSIDVFFWFIFA